MEFTITGKAKNVFGKIRELQEKAEKGDNIIYEGRRHPHEETKIFIIRTEIFTTIICGVPARQVKVCELDPAPSRKLRDHSTDFEWGYPGSGPAQLALALLYDATGDGEISLRYHQPFKEAFVQRWGLSWQIHADEIIRWVSLKENYKTIKER